MGSDRVFSKMERKTKRKPERREQRAIMHPPPLVQVGIVHSSAVRYAATAALGTATNPLVVTFANLLDAFFVAATATTGYQLFDFVKIRKVVVWSYSPSGPVTTTVQFTGKAVGLTGNGLVFSDTSMGIQPAYVSAVPGAKALCGDWQASNSNTAFQIYCPSGSVIDLHLTYRNSMENQAVNAVSQAPVAAGTGYVYARGFDGLAAAASALVPQGYADVR